MRHDSLNVNHAPPPPDTDDDIPWAHAGVIGGVLIGFAALCALGIASVEIKVRRSLEENAQPLFAQATKTPRQADLATQCSAIGMEVMK